MVEDQHVDRRVAPAPGRGETGGDPAVLPAPLPAADGALAAHPSGSEATRQGAVNAPSGRRWRPSASKFAGSSHASHAGRRQAPVGVDHREPGGVAVAALDDRRLPEHPLPGEAEALGGAAARAVEGVALPLEAAVALAEHPTGEEEDRLARRPRALEGRREADVPDLDRPRLGRDPHEAHHPAGRAAREVGDREEQRIGLAGRLGHPGGIGRLVGEGAVGEIVPDRVVRPVRGVERRGEGRRQRLEPGIAPFELHRPRPRRRRPVGDGGAEATFVAHGCWLRGLGVPVIAARRAGGKPASNPPFPRSRLAKPKAWEDPP